jgi:Golgi nucleoside diphosphatase
VGATAGLRLLPGGKADDILAAVKQHLADDYPFQLEQVTIIDGEACPEKRLFGAQWQGWELCTWRN